MYNYPGMLRVIARGVNRNPGPKDRVSANADMHVFVVGQTPVGGHHTNDVFLPYRKPRPPMYIEDAWGCRDDLLADGGVGA